MDKQTQGKIVRFNDNHQTAIEIRNKNDKELKYLSGYAIVFEQRVPIGKHFYEEIDSHALDDADMTTVFLHHNHRTLGVPMAAYRDGDPDNTMELFIDKTGLKYDANIDTDNNADSSSVYSAVKRRDIRNMSFCFCIEVDENGDEWIDIGTDMPLRRIKKIKRLYEISVVNDPAYDQTSVFARDSTVKEAEEILKTARAKLINNSDFELRKKKYKFMEEEHDKRTNFS